MRRLLIHVEGETEETFVNEVLAPHLYAFGIESVGARILGSARIRSGIPAWPSARADLLRHLREDAECSQTTMVDYYGLPQGHARAWPGRGAAGALPFPQKAATVEDAIFEDVRKEFARELKPDRFIPFVLMHEFEALLFSDCHRFASGIGRPGLAPAFQSIRDEFESPEEINDSPVTAPSKRVAMLVTGYQKPFLGNLAALEIGLDRIRGGCPHFDQWVRRLEGLPGAS